MPDPVERVAAQERIGQGGGVHTQPMAEAGPLSGVRRSRTVQQPRGELDAAGGTRAQLCSLSDYVQSAAFRLAGQPGGSADLQGWLPHLDKTTWDRPTVHNQSVCRNSRTRSVGGY